MPSFPTLKIGTKEVKTPIVQGGMGVGISLSKLASAVANEGAIGVIAANAIGMIEDDYFENGKAANIRALKKEIKKAREKTKGYIGVNLMIAINDFHELLDTTIEEKVDFVFLGAGLPLKGIPVEKLRKADIGIIPIVSSARAVELICKFWLKKYNDIPDAFVVEGPKAGGHLGYKLDQIDNPDFALEKLVPQIVEAISKFEKKLNKTIPLIAGGGIFTGEDIYKFIKLGAKGVQMGTRFVATYECDADIKFKETYINCKKEDIVIIKSPVGMPGRAIKNKFLTEVHNGTRKLGKCPWKCLETCNIKKAGYCISSALDNARKGFLEDGYAFAGANAFRIEKLISVKELIANLKREYLFSFDFGFDSIKEEYEKLMDKLAGLKEEYALTFDRLKTLKAEYETTIANKTTELKENYEKNLESLKEEYEKMLQHFNELTNKINNFSLNTNFS